MYSVFKEPLLKKNTKKNPLFKYIYRHDSKIFKYSQYHSIKKNRNSSCSCGSGKKYKKCCINKKDYYDLSVDDLFNNICEKK